jgi:hypothetical protein
VYGRVAASKPAKRANRLPSACLAAQAVDLVPTREAKTKSVSPLFRERNPRPSAWLTESQVRLTPLHKRHPDHGEGDEWAQGSFCCPNRESDEHAQQASSGSSDRKRSRSPTRIRDPLSSSVTLEDLTPGARVKGVLPDRAVIVVATEWRGTQALTLTYRDDRGKVDHELLYRANEARFRTRLPCRLFLLRWPRSSGWWAPTEREPARSWLYSQRVLYSQLL